MHSRITLGRRDLFSLRRHDIFPVIEQTQLDSPTSQDDTGSSSDKPMASSEFSSHVPIVAITREDMPPAFRPFFKPTDVILLKSPSQTQTKNWASEYQKFRRSTKTTPSCQAIDIDKIGRQLQERYVFVSWPQRIARTFGWMALFYLVCFVAPNLLAGRGLAETLWHQANVPVMVMVLLIFLVLELDTLMTKWMDKQSGMYGQGRWGLLSLRHMYRALKSFYAIYKEISNPDNISRYLLRKEDEETPISILEARERFQVLSEDGCGMAILSPYPALVVSPAGTHPAGALGRWLNQLYWVYRAWQRLSLIYPMLSQLPTSIRHRRYQSIARVLKDINFIQPGHADSGLKYLALDLQMGSKGV